HTDPAAHQGAEHGEGPLAAVVDGGGVHPVLVDVAPAVQQVLPRHPYAVEADPPVVHPGQTALAAVVDGGHPGQIGAALVADGHPHAVHSVVLAGDDQPGDLRGHPGVLGRPADVVLGRRGRRGVHHDLVGVRVVFGGGLELLDVGAVPDL